MQVLSRATSNLERGLKEKKGDSSTSEGQREVTYSLTYGSLHNNDLTQTCLDYLTDLFSFILMKAGVKAFMHWHHFSTMRHHPPAFPTSVFRSIISYVLLFCIRNISCQINVLLILGFIWRVWKYDAFMGCNRSILSPGWLRACCRHYSSRKSLLLNYYLLTWHILCPFSRAHRKLSLMAEPNHFLQELVLTIFNVVSSNVVEVSWPEMQFLASSTVKFNIQSVRI